MDHVVRVFSRSLAPSPSPFVCVSVIQFYADNSAQFNSDDVITHHSSQRTRRCEHLFHIIQYNLRCLHGQEFLDEMEVDQFKQLFEPLLDVEFILAGDVASTSRGDASPPRGMAFRVAAVLIAAATLLEGPTTNTTIKAISEFTYPQNPEMHAEVRSYSTGILHATNVGIYHTAADDDADEGEEAAEDEEDEDEEEDDLDGGMHAAAARSPHAGGTMYYQHPRSLLSPDF